MTSTPQKPAASTTVQSEFVPVDTITGVAWGKIIDLEFSPLPKQSEKPRYLMAYLQDQYIYVVKMDPGTGQIAGTVETNPGIPVTDQAPPFWRGAYQGPEWGYNGNDGFSLFFAVLVGGKTQIAYSSLGADDKWSDPVILTDSIEGRMGQTGGRNGSSSTQVNYTRWDPRLRNSDVPEERITERVYYWMDVNERVEHKIPHVMMNSQPPHFFEAPGNGPFCDLVLAMKDKSGVGQVVRYITKSGVPANQRAQFLSSAETDQGHNWDHWDPDCLPANQPGNDKALVYAVKVVEQGEKYPTKIAIYDESSEGPYGKLVLRNIIEIPQLSQDYPTSITSLETISSPAGNQSFLSMRLVTHNNPKPLECDSSIWLFSVDGNLRRQVSGLNASEGNFRGTDPEFMWGENELFIYYNVYDRAADSVDMHLCQTGVRVDGSFIAGQNGE